MVRNTWKVRNGIYFKEMSCVKNGEEQEQAHKELQTKSKIKKASEEKAGVVLQD